MKPTLSIEEIQFIDTYLKNSDVLFDDIRLEMVDHVASEIEVIMLEEGSDFYDAFKGYMAINKRSLQKECHKNYRKKDSKLLRQLFSNVFSVWGAIVVVVSYFALKYFPLQLSTRDVNSFNFFILIIVCVVYLVVSKVKGGRFSTLERMGLFFGIYHYVVRFLLVLEGMVNDKNPSILLLLFFVTMPLFLVHLGIQVYRDYYKRYKVFI